MHSGHLRTNLRTSPALVGDVRKYQNPRSERCSLTGRNRGFGRMWNGLLQFCYLHASTDLRLPRSEGVSR